MRSLLRIICLVGSIALFAVAGILGYNQLRLQHLADVARVQAEDIHAKAKSARTVRQSLITALRDADKVADPLKRCLEFPDVPPLQWPPAFVAERCRLSALSIITAEEIDKKIEAGDVAYIDATFDDYALQDGSNPKERGILFRAFESQFESSNPAIGEVLDRWVKAAPHSAYALAARGVFRVRSAQEERGTASSRETPDANFDAMRSTMALARSDLKASLKINPRFAVAATYLLPARTGADDVAALGRNAAALSPDEYRIYMFWAKESSPLYGGSLEALDEVAKAAEERQGANPLMAQVRARVLYFQKRARAPSLSKADLLEVLTIAPDSFALNNLKTLPLTPTDAELITPLVRFEPTVANYMSAAEALAYARQSEWSNDYVHRAADIGSPMSTDFARYAQALMALHNGQAAEAAYTRVLAANPHSADAMKALTMIYESDLGRHDDAVAMAKRYVVAYPQDESSWSTLAFTYRKTDIPKYCEAMAKAYPDKPVAFWDYEHLCSDSSAQTTPVPTSALRHL